MRVVVNAQLDPQRSGGIAQVVAGLAYGLSRLSGDDEYVLICSPASEEWLGRYLNPPHRIVVNRAPAAPPVAGARPSDGFFESFSPDVIHFPYQAYTRTTIPTVFNPHDLQHVHFPQFFTAEERRCRDALFTAALSHATAIAVASTWVRGDFQRRFEIESHKVQVIPWAAPTDLTNILGAAEPTAAVLSRHRLVPGYGFYPAQTWPHKNHLRLIEALAAARRRGGQDIRIVCTGFPTPHFEEIRRSADKQGVAAYIRFLGWVEESELPALWSAAKFLILPTLFEAASFPIYDAFALGVPMACSNVTSLPEQTAGAALLFDPTDADAMAEVIVRLHKSEKLRAELIRLGKQRASATSWRLTAERYRELYRAVAMHFRRTEPKSLEAASQR